MYHFKLVLVKSWKGEDRQPYGRISIGSAEIDRAGIRAAGPGRRRRSHRVLYFPVIEPEENASGSGTDRHLRQAWKMSEAASRQTCRLSRSPAEAGIQEEDPESAGTAVQRGSRAAS